MGIKGRLFNLLADSFIRTFGLDKATKLSCSLLERIEPCFTVERSGIRYCFSCPNNIVRWRAETYFTKEPGTIQWMDTFKPGDVLFDVGANIGLYSIYAAKKGIQVVAFEPESQNFALLNKNVYLNKCVDRLVCLNIALSDKDSCDYLYLPRFKAGSAINCLGYALDQQGEAFDPAFKQGVMAYALDSFLARGGSFPTHIKVDVDGIEPKIIDGAAKTLVDPRLRSLLIELDDRSSEHAAVIAKIKAAGWVVWSKEHADLCDEKNFSIFNYIFLRP